MCCIELFAFDQMESPQLAFILNFRTRSSMKGYFLRQLALPALLCAPFFVHATGEVPDLKLGMTVRQALAVDSSMAKIMDDQNISIYKAEVSPKGYRTVEAYRLLFSLDKLVWFVALNDTITNDPYGADGKTRYEALRASLIEKYGEPTHEVRSTGKYGLEPHEFYLCLSFSATCGQWTTRFTTPDKVVSIELLGIVEVDRGQINMREESVPGYTNAISLFRHLQTIELAVWAIAGVLSLAVATLLWRLREGNRAKVDSARAVTAIEPLVTATAPRSSELRIDS